MRVLRLAWVAILIGVLAPSAASAATAPELVAAQLAGAAAAGVITPAEHAACTAAYARVRATRGVPAGAARELAGVRKDTESLAARGSLTAAARAACRTLGVNVDWFAAQRRGPAASGARTGFGGSEVVWQAYPGHGWQIQPLGSFGALNGIIKLRRGVPRAVKLADEMLALAVNRGGALRNEYLFEWGGAPAGWASAMAAATGAQALSRVYQRTAVDTYRQGAQQLLSIFHLPPPAGIRLDRGAGRAHYLLYSGTPDLLVGNGHAQAVLGLLTYTQTTGDTGGQALLDAGLREAEIAFPTYDTGAWSLYARTASAPGSESDLAYHRLFTGFLGQLCRQTGRPVFCALQQRFVAYEAQPIALARPGLRVAARRLVVPVRASKRGRLSVTLLRGAQRVRTVGVTTLSGGLRTFRLPRPSAGRYRVTVQAVSLTGRTTTASSRTVTVRRR